MPETPNETIKKLDEKIAQLQAQKKAIENREKARLKKERTKKLLKYGELIENRFGDISIEDLEKKLKAL